MGRHIRNGVPYGGTVNDSRMVKHKDTTVFEAIEDTNSNLSDLYKKVWENPTPTASMGAVTISVDLSNYDYVDIVARPYSQDSHTVCARIFKDSTSIIDSFSGSLRLWRRFTVNANNIILSNGYSFNVRTSSTDTVEDIRFVPVAIYAGKLTS